MKNTLERLKIEFYNELKEIESLTGKEALAKLNELKIRFSGKKSEFTAILKNLGSLSQEERPRVGAIANRIKKSIEEDLARQITLIQEKINKEELKSQGIDWTLPGRGLGGGTLHPLTMIEREVIEIFSYLGFEVSGGPELEDDFHNFEALNIPKNHPARDMQDTLYINENLVLRSQTSSVQIRVMERRTPPIRIISGQGRVYRSDYDPTHSPMFTQLEGLAVDENISFSNYCRWSSHINRNF